MLFYHLCLVTRHQDYLTFIVKLQIYTCLQITIITVLKVHYVGQMENKGKKLTEKLKKTKQNNNENLECKIRPLRVSIVLLFLVYYYVNIYLIIFYYSNYLKVYKHSFS